MLCVTCFKLSPHRSHKYKMGTSSGGGCCDCGDAEAWKRDAACTLHATAREVTDTSAVIGPAMRERCALIFEAVLQYCVQALRIETDAALKATDGTGCADDDQIYCTVMYNDETHTFEQVIHTLTRIVGCSQKDAVDFVSLIDREGRAVVRCAPFDVCMKLKDEIENTAPRAMVHVAKATHLKVAVLHMNAVACQQLGLQLLGWLQEFCGRHPIFRQVFTHCMLQGNAHHLQHIMMYDWKLWKTARLSWHHLLITAMLTEYENKKQLALVFTKLYPSLMADYIRDDHDHSFSVVSLSVQLFTVPSIAQHLIAHESAFFKLMHTFYSESIEKYVTKKVLMFARQTTNQNIFKRSAYILFDLKYILSFRPDVWTDELRKNFLHGVQVLMRLLREMQGMDSVFRQTGQHMEYEPEWESAFNLHIKLAHVITLVLEWCGTDEVVLVKVYRMVMANLAESEFILGQAKPELKELADHSTSALMYDVSSKNVSIHLPLSRFFAGLYLHLQRFGRTFDDVLGAGITQPKPAELIEPVLCTQTMIAQVHSGLWRRNGYSLLNQLYFYRNVKCRAEMLDRDVIMLQIGAALIEANEFLIHVMSKFNLMAWAAPDFEQQTPEEDGIRQTINMVDEMLELLIVVLGERHMPGVARVDERQRLTKELVQQLCIKPHSHSELSKSLSDGQQADVEDIIGELAQFEKPRAGRIDQKGVYVLRREHYDAYNMFYYHYTKEEKSRSEETHRARRKAANLLDCCPPPRLPVLCDNFRTLVCVFNCDVMLLVMETVLRRSLDLKARHFSESHLQKVVHLIGYALHEEESGAYEFFRFVQKAADRRLLQMLEELVNSARVEVHRDLLLWTVRRFQAVQTKVAEAQAREAGGVFAMGDEPASVPSSSDAIAPEPAEQMESNSGGQHSSSVSSAVPVAAAEDDATSASTTTTSEALPECELAKASSQSAVDAERAEKEQRQRLAAERRAKIMAQIRSAQTSFMNTNAELFQSTDTAEKAVEAIETATATAAPMDWQTATAAAGDPDGSSAAAAAAASTGDSDAQRPTQITACLGQPKKVLQPIPNDEYTCILCSEDAIVDTGNPQCMVFSAFIQTSKVMAQANNQAVSPHVNSCGHVMHGACWAKYFESEALKESRRPNRMRAPGTFHIEKKEFLCPLCRCLSNTVLPVPTALTNYALPPAQRVAADGAIVVHAADSDADSDSTVAMPPVTFPVWLAIMHNYTSVLGYTAHTALSTDAGGLLPDLAQLADLVSKHAPFAAFRACCPPTIARHSLAPELNQYSESFIEMCRKVSPFPFAAESCEPYLVGWLACAYTVEALEMQLRATDKPLNGHMSIRQRSGLRGLLRTCGLLSVCATTHVAARLSVHLRGLLHTVFGHADGDATMATSSDAEDDVPASVVTYDVFKMMTSLVFMLPSVLYVKSNECAVPSGQLMEFYLLKLMHVANLVKVLLLHREEEEEEEDDGVADAEPDADDAGAMDVDVTTSVGGGSGGVDDNNDVVDDDPLIAFYNKYNFHAAGESSRRRRQKAVAPAMTRPRLNAIIAAGSATFLRCSVLLFNTITDIEMPDELARPVSAGSAASDYASMCLYLGLNPDASDYLSAAAGSEATLAFATRLAENPAHAKLRRGAPVAAAEARIARQAIVPAVTPISEFVRLPEDYSDLINSVSQFQCPNNVRDDTRNPTMCLICGAILCSMTYCCQVEVNGATVGACTAHTISCGAGVGAFLRIRDCEVLLLGFNKGCFVAAPYLDEYGETDQGLRRGNALRLNETKLRKLHIMWLTHCMHEDIARLAESSNSMIQTQWQNM